MHRDLRYTAAQIRAELAHLERLAELGPCDQPPATANSWCDPVWLTAWLRNHPDEIQRQRQTLTAELARMNMRNR